MIVLLRQNLCGGHQRALVAVFYGAAGGSGGHHGLAGAHIALTETVHGAVECGDAEWCAPHVALVVQASAFCAEMCGCGDDCGGSGSSSDYRATEQDNG